MSNYNILYTLLASLFFGICLYFVYLYAKKIVSKKVINLIFGTWAILTLCTFLGYLPIAFLVFLVFFLGIIIYIGRQARKGVREFYDEQKIYQSTYIPPAVLQLLGDRKWTCADGNIVTKHKRIIAYNWWIGYTKSTSYNGKTTSTIYQYYLAISFPPGAVSDAFKNMAKAATKPKRSFWEKVKFFFVLDTDTPYLVEETANGYFVIAWKTVLTKLHFTHKIEWLKENLS